MSRAYVLLPILGVLVAGAGKPPPKRLILDTGILEPSASLAEPAMHDLAYDLGGLEKAPGTPQEVVADAEKLLLTGRYNEARPLLDQIADDPDLALQSNFMEGYVALKTRDYAIAEQRLRTAVELAPEFARARAELGQALLAQGKRKEADEQFEIAERDKSLPQEVQDLIRSSRRITAEKVGWYLNVDAAAIADDNVNNGLERELVTLTSNGQSRVVRVSPERLRKSSFGLFSSARAGVEVRTGPNTALSVEAEASIMDFDGDIADEFAVLLAAGPELTFSSGAASLQTFAYERSYAEVTSARGVGIRARYQDRLGKSERVYVYLDGRSIDSGYGETQEGWQGNGLIAYEHTLRPGLSMSATLLIQREWLGSETASNTEVSAFYGFGFYLPLQLRAGGSIGITRVDFDGISSSLSDNPRSDWRYNAGLYVTTRQPLWIGIRPTVGYSFLLTDSSIPLFDTERHRFRLNLAKRF
jgi:tetratricopeptide (TPR) repeat protein